MTVALQWSDQADAVARALSFCSFLYPYPFRFCARAGARVRRGGEQQDAVAVGEGGRSSRSVFPCLSLSLSVRGASCARWDG